MIDKIGLGHCDPNCGLHKVYPDDWKQISKEFKISIVHLSNKM